MKDYLTISVVIPLYFCESCIESLIKELIDILNPFQFEIILVDDNSKDHTWEKVKALKKLYPQYIKVVRLSRNYGQQKATFCGLMKASGNIIITTDDDGSHPLNYLPEAIEKFLKENLDILYITPEKYNYSWYRKILSQIYKSVSRYENPDAGKGSSFRIMSKKLVDSIIQHSSHLIVIDELILWYTQNIQSVTIPYRPSQKNKSTYSYSRLFLLSKNTLMISTTMPLILVKSIGFMVAALSFLTGIYYLIQKFIFHHAEKGYTSIIVSILFGTGLILFSLGVIGEYIAYILMDIHKKPPYHIKEEL
ncbi:MAG: glycosyl transferase family 2 [Bacteroidia bacterium]|nr:MAG: glycosyl transferase family 2 [Bacteroidia bacterium]